MNRDDLVLLALLFFIFSKGGGGLGFKIPGPKPLIKPAPPAWWPDVPEPAGWPAGAPWPPFDEHGVLTLPKDVKVRRAS